MRLVGIDPSGSSLDRIVRCNASAALPQVHDGYDRDFRDKGTAIDGYLERVSQVGAEAALAEVDEQWRDVCANVELAPLVEQLKLKHQVAIAYNWRDDTARYLQLKGKRQYEVNPECEVPATMDLGGVEGREVIVGDYKGPYAWLPAPADSLQLGVAALALARIHRARSARVEYIRILTDGRPLVFRAHLDVFALEGVADKIRTTMEDVQRLRVAVAEGTTPNVTEGPWCRFCSAKAHCPAKTQLVRSVLAGEGAKKLSLREPITAANVGHVYALVKRTKEGIRIAEKALHAYERDGEPSTPEQLGPSAIPVGEDPDGSRRYYGRFERPGNEQLDGKVVYEVLAAKFGPEAAAKACAMEASKDAIRDVLREHKSKDETLKAAEEAVLVEIRTRGGAKRPPTDKPTEFTIAPDGSAKKASRKKAS